MEPSRPESTRQSPGPRLEAVLARPRLEDRLNGILTRRLAIIIGGAGFGKSTLVAAWATSGQGSPTAWLALDPAARELRSLVLRTSQALGRAVPDLPRDAAGAVENASTGDDGDAIIRAESIAAILCEALDSRLDGPVVLVFDDLHEIDGSAAALAFVRALVRGAPRDLHVVLTSRLAVGFPVERLRAQGEVVEIAAQELRFDRDEIAALLAQLEPSETDLVDDVLAVTGGWPALTRLVIETFRSEKPEERRASLDRMRAPEGPLLSYIAEEVLGNESTETLDVLHIACTFDAVTAGLLVAVGRPDGPALLDDLARRAFFVERRPDGGGDTSYLIHGLVRDYATTRQPIDPAEIRRLHAAAAAWHDAAARYADSLREWLQAGDLTGVAAGLAEHGFDIVAAGSLDVVVDASQALPETARSAEIETILGDALMRRGEYDVALAAFQRAGADAEPLPAALAWRIGLIQHELGDVGAALETFTRADLDHGAPDDLALVAAWRAIVHWQRSDPEGVRRWAAFALDLAQRSSDDRVLACALAAAGSLAHMDRDLRLSTDSFRRAVEAAERASDVLLQIRFRSDHGYVLGATGRYAEALAQLDESIRLASGLGRSTFLALTLTDRGHIHLGLGHLEEAAADFSAAREIFEQLGSRWVAYAMWGQATLHRMRGDQVVARALFRDVVVEAEQMGGPWFHADAIAGIAATLVDEDPDEALRLLETAAATVPAGAPAAWAVTSARVALGAGRPDVAARFADEAYRVAEESTDLPSLAGALEVRAQLEPDPDRRRELLDEAETLWIEMPSPFGYAVNALTRAEMFGGSDGLAAARHAQANFSAMGARRLADRAGLVADRLAASARPPAEIRSLGSFQVLRSGEPVGLGEWQSKKARDLLKLLVTRRGRATARDQLGELLWPDAEPEPASNRLSVALATIRTVLDPDRRFPADHFIRSDKTAVSLDLAHIRVDVERFLDAAATAQRGALTGEAVSRDSLAAVEALYGGDFLEEDQAEEWSGPLREIARAAYQTIARELARRSSADGDPDNAVRLLLRILDHDPYDEQAHLELIRTLAAAGRHGEARRRYRLYGARMEEIDLEAAAYPGGTGSVALAIGA